MENMKLEGYEPVVYIKEEYTNISALNPIDLNIQDEEDEIGGDKSEHKVYCSLTVVNPEEITCDSIGSDDYNSDWVFGLQSTTTTTTDGDQLAQQSIKNNDSIQSVVECELSNDSTFSRLNDNSSSDNSNMYTYYTLPNDSSLVNFSHHEATHKRVDFINWNNVVPEQKKAVAKVEKSPPVKKTFPCPICQKVFASKSNLERHGVVHSDVKPFQCVECKRMFSRRVHLERHKFLHMDQKPYNCEICKKGFTQKGHLEKHRYIHSDVKPFECLQCKKTFARKESLNRHKATHAANEKKDAIADNKDVNEKLLSINNECTAERKEVVGTNNVPKIIIDSADVKDNSITLKPPDTVQLIENTVVKTEKVSSEISEVVE